MADKKPMKRWKAIRKTEFNPRPGEFYSYRGKRRPYTRLYQAGSVIEFPERPDKNWVETDDPLTVGDYRIERVQGYRCRKCGSEEEADSFGPKECCNAPMHPTEIRIKQPLPRLRGNQTLYDLPPGDPDRLERE